MANAHPTTLESQWQFDMGINADISAEGSSDTLTLLRELMACDRVIESGDSDADTPEMNDAKDRREAIKGELG